MHPPLLAGQFVAGLDVPGLGHEAGRHGGDEGLRHDRLG
ncbi:hypothetical protein D187_004985 [Cystobacter fuscus DSM 2262]|uniref:Uncharacterized protein n=1 Tax=Cystobacter fuscus (strain ATCC 25194 / DSM 2262 / NBRC 100088 / M29) TaxID=1242864 RepID=S9PLE8_CYSF2|nr:hypothetical protein D187_004985 [Cystobacter fuscus DSM 2262]